MVGNKTSLIGAIGFFIILTILLVLPGSAFPEEKFLSKLYFDKFVHIGLFAILAFLFIGSFKYPSQKIFVIVFLCGSAYGIIMEFVQKYWAINREFEIADMVADA